MLQPASLASIEMGLNEYGYEWLMISIYVTYITMKIMSPLHACQVYGQKFMICDMVPGFGGGEFFTIECHRTSTL